MFKHIIFIAFLIHLIHVRAEDENSDTEKDDESRSLNKVELYRGKIGNFSRRQIHRFDQFFNDENVEEETQKSYIRISPSVLISEGGSIDKRLDIDVYIHLPNLENKGRFFIQSVTEKFESDFLEDLLFDDENDEGDELNKDDSITVGLQYDFIREQKMHLKLSAGPKYRDSSLQTYIKVRGRYSFKISDWDYRLTQNIFYDDHEYGERSAIDISRLLTRKSMLRFSSAALWTESTDNVELSHSLLYRYALTQTSAISPKISMFYTTNEPVVVDHYRFAIEYRRRLRYDWCQLIVRPAIHYPRLEDYKSETTLFIELGLTF
ncbi:MAG: DUF481 domain-containing protein [Lentisphaeria bacterium]|nr:DUF481 domain-containing protein [Lentisphaeria bacterium]